ncbi:protein SPEAR1-like [Impatiens glandulifera]|uniref:protein SPEAR1-like n=1 Tax=Impatiens glandulifera TaxID=253017 RepID=UPI001FB0C2B9|nr:protein SPEAR1-like [Impatiens glandulifera]
MNIGSNDHQRSSGSSSSSSRKSRKNNSSEKPKQPQRGLGVAQLEKIRLHGQMAAYNSSVSTPSNSSSICSYGFQPHPQNFLMGLNYEHNRANISFGDSQATTTREEGSMGLLKSVEKFKPQAGCRFAIYAYWWIRQSIRKAIF